MSQSFISINDVTSFVVAESSYSKHKNVYHASLSSDVPLLQANSRHVSLGNWSFMMDNWEFERVKRFEYLICMVNVEIKLDKFMHHHLG